eukprot:CAMPEP_0171237846 /NCGR_PEP_ID=MMETSP0790-20130122/43174_1 /TAXON_ID=2925 /ORGANISM="Alexandrium catenella, Strain OF101" /LENGTH=36 /DNA_ID= /DNA_START= /DNA_END= /DNA_ORIENTATION=
MTYRLLGHKNYANLIAPQAIRAPAFPVALEALPLTG